VQRYTAKYDGKDYSFPGLRGTQSLSTRIDTYTSVATFKRSGRVVQRIGIIVSKDGKVLMLRAKGTNASGQLISNLEVFDKQ